MSKNKYFKRSQLNVETRHNRYANRPKKKIEIFFIVCIRNHIESFTIPAKPITTRVVNVFCLIFKFEGSWRLLENSILDLFITIEL